MKRRGAPAFWAACAAVVPACAFAQPAPGWTLARSAHFEVYAQAGEQPARAALAWFEQLRAFLVRQTGLKLEGMPPVRVIGFRSARDYELYRPRAVSSAYYLGTESRDYIVLPALGASQFGMAAHEYAHAMLHAGGFRLPPWLAEGLAEYFSTVRIGERGSSIGGDLPQRSQTLRRGQWIPLSRLLEATGGAEVFYAESWTVAEMLLLAPEYAPRLPLLVATLASGTPGAKALSATYGKPLDVVERDARAWAGRAHPAPLALPGVTAAAVETQVSDLPAPASRALVADLLAAEGELDRAEAAWRALDRETPGSADAAAALGTIALRRGDRAGARREWKRAIEHGVSDPVLCYRYASLASMAGIADEEIRPALERALALQPEYDDARYQLALLEKNAGRYEAALRHLRTMGQVSPARAFAWWSAVADALTGLDRREEAGDAARHAAENAGDDAERAHAAQLAYVAATEITVRMAPGAEGQARMVATRMPAGTSDWNPFIEPDDDIRRVSGTLREIDCGKVMRLVVETAAGPLALAIPDPYRMQVRNGPEEFTCGPQPAAQVAVAYAVGAMHDPKADGVVRGIEFR